VAVFADSTLRQFEGALRQPHYIGASLECQAEDAESSRFMASGCYTYGCMSAVRRSFLWILFFAVLFGVLPQAKRRIGARGESRQTKPRNVYLITATGLCSSHLSSYLYQHMQTPAIDFLAYDGVRFLHAYSPSVDSLSAHLSVLTGLYPFNKILRSGIDSLRSGGSLSQPLLSNWFQQNGYRTAAFVADPELRIPALFAGSFEDATAGRMLPRWQDSYSCAEVCTLAKEWTLQHRAFPQFVLLNLNEPTEPFLPPAPHDRHYRNHPYDGEIAAVDEQIGLFIHSLKTSGLFQHSIVVFTSTYGACSDEEDNSSKDEERIHVPLMIAAPEILPRHQEYDRQVSLIDIAPTIFELLETPVNQVLDGVPLFEKGTTRQIERKVVFGQFNAPWMSASPFRYYARTARSLWISNEGTAESAAARSLVERLKQEGITLPSEQ